MKKIIVSFFLSLMIVMNVGADSIESVFTDVSDKTDYSPAIQWMAENKVINGYEDGSFKPDKCVNRAEFLKMLFVVQEAELSSVEDLSFSDVNNSAWYAPYLATALQTKIVEGYNDGTFKPEQCVTRAEAAKMVVASFRLGKKSFKEAEESVSLEFKIEKIENGVNVWEETELDELYFERADITFSYSYKPLVSITLSSEGTELFKEITANNIGKKIGIFVEGELISAPVVNDVITGGVAVITGDFTLEEASDLVDYLNSTGDGAKDLDYYKNNIEYADFELTDWFYTDLHRLLDDKLIGVNHVEENKFGPNKDMSRKEAAELLYTVKADREVLYYGWTFFMKTNLITKEETNRIEKLIESPRDLFHDDSYGIITGIVDFDTVIPLSPMGVHCAKNLETTKIYCTNLWYIEFPRYWNFKLKVPEGEYMVYSWYEGDRATLTDPPFRAPYNTTRFTSSDEAVQVKVKAGEIISGITVNYYNPVIFPEEEYINKWLIDN